MMGKNAWKSLNVVFINRISLTRLNKQNTQKTAFFVSTSVTVLPLILCFMCFCLLYYFCLNAIKSEQKFFFCKIGLKTSVNLYFVDFFSILFRVKYENVILSINNMDFLWFLLVPQNLLHFHFEFYMTFFLKCPINNVLNSLKLLKTFPIFSHFLHFLFYIEAFT